MTFKRIKPDGFPVNHDSLCGQFAGVGGTHCVILCSGPSLSDVIDDYNDCWPTNPAGSVTDWSVFSVNCSHEHWPWAPDFWASFDWAYRFDEQVFHDPKVMKFFPDFRANELATETLLTHELPNTVFCDIQDKSYADFFGTGPIVNAEDSMLQAIDIAIRLGFKNLYLAGADLHVKLSPQQEAWFKERQEDFQQCDVVNSLWETLIGIARKHITGSMEGEITPDIAQKIQDAAKELVNQLDQLESEDLYSFGQAGTSMFGRIQADHHYRISSSRLTKARRCLDGLGVKLTLLKPSWGTLEAFKSRLDGWFPACSVFDLPLIEKRTLPDYTRRGMTVRNDPPSRGKVQQEIAG